jgi:hypothetical protein
MFPIGSSRRRLLNQSTHSRVADAIFAATGERLREMPFSRSVDFA